jgi:hypothetical protein
VSQWVREDALLNGIFGFFAERVFGPRRRELFEQDLKQVDLEGGKKAVVRLEALERSIEQLDAPDTADSKPGAHKRPPWGNVSQDSRPHERD